jgi:hypothetical protein
MLPTAGFKITGLKTSTTEVTPTSMVNEADEAGNSNFMTARYFMVIYGSVKDITVISNLTAPDGERN